MSGKENPMNNPNAPHNQPFNISGKKRAGKNGWWLRGNNNQVKKGDK